MICDFRLCGHIRYVSVLLNDDRGPITEVRPYSMMVFPNNEQVFALSGYAIDDELQTLISHFHFRSHSIVE